MMKKDPQNQYAIKGAVIGGLIASGIPLLLLLYSSIHYKGGGANIGLGLLFLAMPVYLPIAIGLGWIIGKKLDKQ